jgi:hypothetical protein
MAWHEGEYVFATMNRLERLREVPDAAWTATPPRLPARIAGALARDPARVWLISRMAFAYAAVSVFARVLPLPKAFALLSPRLGPDRGEASGAERIVNALDTLLTARIPFVHPQCWRRAAVLHRFLRHAGLDTLIVFGVRMDGTRTVEAHAWLERNGQPFAETGQTTAYQRVFEFPASPLE